jgi:hypothetical protein
VISASKKKVWHPWPFSARRYAYTSDRKIILPGENMKTILIAGVSLFITSIASISAQAGTIGITYNFAGAAVAPPVLSGTTLIIDNSATGSILSGNPSLDAVFNPVTFLNHCLIDVTTGILNGTITFAFADGATLFGTEVEDVSALVASGGTGPFTETYTFTGGTGRFSGASGSVSGAGVGVATGFTESGSGTLTAAGVSSPEPASVFLIIGGLLVMAASRRVRLYTSASER